MYAAGLRVSEVISIKIGEIDLDNQTTKLKSNLNKKQTDAKEKISKTTNDLKSKVEK